MGMKKQVETPSIKTARDQTITTHSSLIAISEVWLRSFGGIGRHKIIKNTGQLLNPLHLFILTESIVCVLYCPIRNRNGIVEITEHACVSSYAYVL